MFQRVRKVILCGTRQELGFFRSAVIVGPYDNFFPAIQTYLKKDNGSDLHTIRLLVDRRELLSPASGAYISGGACWYERDPDGDEAFDFEEDNSIDDSYSIEKAALLGSWAPLTKWKAAQSWQFIRLSDLQSDRPLNTFL